MSLSRMRSLPVIAFVLTAILLSASSAAAYNEENVAAIQMQRLDDVSCTAPIRITALLTDSSAKPVPAAVQFSYATSETGDTISPTTTSSDTAGLAQTTIELSCVDGARTIRASVPGDGSAQIVVTCGPSNGCTIEPVASAAPATDADAIPPTPAGTPADEGPLRGLAALLLGAICIGALGFVGWSRRRAHGRP
jgi:hypothetical protein